MGEDSKTLKSKSLDLYRQYEWFASSFLPKIKKASKEFFSDIFSINLISISENINILAQGSNYFVTKVRVDKLNNVFIRCSEEAIELILDTVLGKSTRKFDLETLSELEAKIITSFNDFMYDNFCQYIRLTPEAQKSKKIDLVHLTLFLKGKDEVSQGSGKVIISIPTKLLSPEGIVNTSEKFKETDFFNSKIDVNIRLGTTKFLVRDIKRLEKGDLVICENSNINYMTVVHKDFERRFGVKPNPGLIISVDEDNIGGNNMTDFSQDLWDNLEVEMGAEFDKVKITLGELKNIEQGLVLDLNSIYNNKISLKVENKVIARGELVIINDRYGVRIEEIMSSDGDNAQSEIQPPIATAQPQQEAATLPKEGQDQAPTTEQDNSDDFDYSDFDLENEDI